MTDNIFGNLTDEERNNIWMYMFSIMYCPESIIPLNDKRKLLEFNKSCKDYINEKRKKPDALPQGFDYALCWAESEDGA